MKRYLPLITLFVVLFAASVSMGIAANKDKPSTTTPGMQIADTGWNKRCEAKDKKKCEIFQQLVEANSKSRVAEFAISPETAKGASGVIVLPLGILLEKGVGMQIDNGKIYRFNVRYCTAAGCFAYVNLEKTLMTSMKSGGTAKFIFLAGNGQNVNLLLSLKGFNKAIEQL